MIFGYQNIRYKSMYYYLAKQCVQCTGEAQGSSAPETWLREQESSAGVQKYSIVSKTHIHTDSQCGAVSALRDDPLLPGPLLFREEKCILLYTEGRKNGLINSSLPLIITSDYEEAKKCIFFSNKEVQAIQIFY